MHKSFIFCFLLFLDAKIRVWEAVFVLSSTARYDLWLIVVKNMVSSRSNRLIHRKLLWRLGY